jgi:hypothetical protein
VKAVREAEARLEATRRLDPQASLLRHPIAQQVEKADQGP